MRSTVNDLCRVSGKMCRMIVVGGLWKMMVYQVGNIRLRQRN